MSSGTRQKWRLDGRMIYCEDCKAYGVCYAYKVANDGDTMETERLVKCCPRCACVDIKVI